MLVRLRLVLWLLAASVLPNAWIPAQEGGEPSREEAAPPTRRERPQDPAAAAEEDEGPAQATPFDALRWRQIGPASMGGRIVDLEMVPTDPKTFYLGSASGGVFKTTNRGTTFEPVFEREGSCSIGDVAVAPSDPNVVWIGTGENNARNSVSYGDGVYKSTDGGKTWKHMGLRESFQIGAIAIHPTNPDVVFVGALGRLWGENEERGLHRTSDGGATWERVLWVDERTGCITVAFQPGNPDVLLAAMYERQRDATDANDPIKRYGPGAGLYRSADGGHSWARMTQGLPTANLGRIAFDFWAKDPQVVFALIESERIGESGGSVSTNPRRRPRGHLGVQGDEEFEGGARVAEVVEGGAAEEGGLEKEDVIIQFGDEKVESFNELARAIRRKRAGDVVTVRYKRGDVEQETEVTLGEPPSQGGGGGGQRPFGTRLGGQQQNVQERQGKEGFETGGLYRSADGGVSWTRINSINPRPFYFSHVRVDPSDENYVYVSGIELHVSEDGGKTFRSDGAQRVHSDHHALWIDPQDGRHLILGTDGGMYQSFDRTKTWDFVDNLALGQYYHVAMTNQRPFHVYGGLQDNGSWGGPGETPGRSGPINEDWIQFGSGDGFVCRVDPEDPDLVYYESQNGGMGRVNLRTGERGGIRPGRQEGISRVRFNWKTPFVLSPHNSRIFFAAGNYVFRSWDRGNDLHAVSPEITITDDGCGSAVEQSPRDANFLMAGTTDGALWVTRDGCGKWERVDAKLPDLPGPRWVSAIEMSRAKTGRAYVTLEGHRHDDDAAYVYVTEDFGVTWKRLGKDLPQTTTRAIREDPVNSDLLYLATEHGLFVSLDRGRTFQRFNQNLPTVAVHDVAAQPNVPEIVAATHGRSLWAIDVTALRQLTRRVQRADAHLFEPSVAFLWNAGFASRGYGVRTYEGENPPSGAPIHYYLGKEAKDVSLVVQTLEGETVATLTAKKTAGLHRVEWNLRRGGGGRGGPGGRGGAGRGGFGRGGAAVGPDRYFVVLTVDGKEQRKALTVERDPRRAAEAGVLTPR